MADDQEKTEVPSYLNTKATSHFCYACRYGTKVKSFQDFSGFF
jgi:hypothetical protein